MDEHEISLRMAWSDLRQFLSNTLPDKDFGDLLRELNDPLRELFEPSPLAFDAMPTRPEIEIATRSLVKFCTGEYTRDEIDEVTRLLGRLCGEKIVNEEAKNLGGAPSKHLVPVEKWFNQLSEGDQKLRNLKLAEIYCLKHPDPDRVTKDHDPRVERVRKIIAEIKKKRGIT